MPAFMVFIREKTLDQSELEAYWSKVSATMEGRAIWRRTTSVYLPSSSTHLAATASPSSSRPA
jgi:hypothetical protein